MRDSVAGTLGARCGALPGRLGVRHLPGYPQPEAADEPQPRQAPVVALRLQDTAKILAAAAQVSEGGLEVERVADEEPLHGGVRGNAGVAGHLLLDRGEQPVRVL